MEAFPICKNDESINQNQSLDSELIERYRSLFRYPGITLTKREAECFFLLAKFSTVKKIARVLKLSPRTVESYLNQVKRKMNINFKADLIEKANEMMTEKSLWQKEQ